MSTFNSHSAAAARLAETGSRSPRKAFALHLGEMLVAMFAGMLVLGLVIVGALALAGTSLSAVPAAAQAAVMGFVMTAPMMWWMRFRGHPSRHNVEMAGSMLVPTALVIVVLWLGALSEDAVLLAQHVVMIPAMVGVMLWRYDHYSH